MSVPLEGRGPAQDRPAPGAQRRPRGAGDVWISDRYAGQQELGREHQVCLAHVLRDVQYAIDCGDTIFAPKIRDHLRWTIRVGKRRSSLKDTTLAAYAAKADSQLTRLMRMPIAHPAGQFLLR